MNWKGYIKTLLGTTFVGAATVYAWILLVDPYANVWFSPPAEREPISKNQRFSYPALARNLRFDSIIVGTSSVRLLNPDRLDAMLGASFANLAMDASTAYEQSEILKLFARHHPDARYAFFGVDNMTYCHPTEPYKQFTERPFPPWMYDENQWNDLLYLFNSATVEQAWRQFRNILGLRKPKFGSDGYTDFLPPESQYDLEKVRTLIYGDEPREVKPPVVPPEKISAEEQAGWTFPNLALLSEMLHAMPADTVKALILPPYHHFRMPVAGSRDFAILEACKLRLAKLAETVPNTTIVDFWRRSQISLQDENYWDHVHYKVGIAPTLECAIAETIRSGRTESDLDGLLSWCGNSPDRANTGSK